MHPMDNSSPKWSDQQQAIFNNFAQGKGNTVVTARAGTGKTTTILEGISYVKTGKVLLAAFNKKIAEELKSRIKNPRAEAKTLHSIGFGFVMKNWAPVNVDSDRGNRLALRAIEGMTGRRLEKFGTKEMLNAVRQLTSIAKNVTIEPTVDQLIDLAYEYNLDPDEEKGGDYTVKQVAECAFAAIELSLEKDGTLDFDDMVYIPVRMKWITPRYDMVVIDEAQDMNIVQLTLAQKICKPGGRIMVVGDDRQAIYGFRGADSNSIARLKKELKATDLKLTTTYRCAQKVVEYAQSLVPDINAAPSNGVGTIREIDFHNIKKEAKPTDFVLSRTNAPLTKACLQLIRGGIRAKIEGKDIGKTLLALVKKIAHGTQDIEFFIDRINVWEEAQTRRLLATKKKAAEKKVEFVRDQAEMLRAIAEDSDSMAQFESKLFDLFADTGGKGDYVICSSVHKAKGLESKNVFVLRDTLYPGGQRGNPEEANIEYVAVTRAKENLIWVNGLD